VLRAGLVARSYRVTDANDPVFINSFFNSTVTSTVDNPLLGTYTLGLVVSDGIAESAVDQVTVRAFVGNAPPNALAGADRSARVADLVEVDGSASFDSDAAALPLSYQWRFAELPDSSSLDNDDIAGANTAFASFTPDVAGDYILELIARDGAPDSSDSDQITIRVASAGNQPNAVAGSDQAVASCETVSLDASASNDPDGAALSYAWTLVSRPTGSSLGNINIANRNAAGASFSPD